MAEQISLKLKGLYTFPNELSEVPEGALSVANNVVLNAESVLEPRRGMNRQTYGFSNAAHRANKLYDYQDKLLSHRSTSTLAYYVDASGWTDYSGTFTAPTGVPKVRSGQSNQNIYFCTSTGIQKLDSYTATPSSAGIAKGLDGSGTTTGASGFLTTAFQCAYRVVFTYTDANNNLILGAPSQRIIVSNVAGANRDVSLTFTLPSTITTAHTFQVYRSAQVPTSTEPNDELKLVYENNPTSGEVSAKSVTFTDSTIDDLRGAALYTNASQEGIVQANDQPPIANDIAVFQGFTFLGNTKSKHRYYLNLLGTSATAAASTPSLSAGDIVIIAGVAYVGVTGAATIANREFSVVTAGSASQNIEDTAKSLIKTINQYTGNTLVYAYYLSGYDDLPGQILIEERSIGGNAFYIASSEDDCWNPRVPVFQSFATGDVSTGSDTITIASHGYTDGQTVSFASTTTLPGGLSSDTVYYIVSAATNTFKVSTSSGGSAVDITSAGSGTHYVFRSTEVSANDQYLNGLYYSKYLQPEAVPLLNFFRVGSAQKKILRIIALRDSLFILKEDGAYRLTGTDTSNFRVDLFDNTVRLIGVETAVNLNNQIFCLSDQGVVTITETGVSVVSRPIESDITDLFTGDLLTATKNYGFGVAYESERRYMLCVPTLSTDTYSSQQYIFNTFTNSWTRWTLRVQDGIVRDSENKLYMASADSNYILPEFKDLTFKDYADYGSTVNITAVSSTSLTLDDVSGVAVGDIIYQSSTLYSRVISINAATLVVTIANALSFTVASATIYKAIATDIEWVPITGQNPGISKQFREILFLFKDNYVGSADISFSSEVSPGFDSVTVEGSATSSWGLFSWGEASWGGTSVKKPSRTYVMPEKQRCSQLIVKFEHSIGYSRFKLNGISLTFEATGERVLRA